MRTITLKIAAGSQEQIGSTGDYVRVKLAPYDLLIENTDTGEIVEAAQGDDFQLSPFKELRVTNTGGVDSIFKLTIATGKKAGSSPATLSGSVSLSAPVALDAPTIAALAAPVALDAPTIAALAAVENGAAVQSRATVTNINQVLIAANAARRYLLIQNNDTSAVLRVTLNGVAATASAGFRVQAGGTLEIPNFCVTGAVNCMMETASASAENVEFVSA